MRVPLSWLREFVPVEAEADEIAERLSLRALTVDEIVRTGADIRGVVVGEVRAVAEHPNADSLMLVKAFDGQGVRDIVCGARNYALGDKVPLALPGARLPGGIEIGERKVRGEVSHGMLCSARELRLSDDHSGIMILDADAAAGSDLVVALELDDTILDIDVTPNRPDALSVVGIAREVAVLFGLSLTVPESRVEQADARTGIPVTIEDPDGCGRYLARVIEDVRIGPSPWWMRRRLLAAGMRPVSNVVDVTNYVMLERGQPLHAFDIDRLEGPAIVVRGAAEDETIVTLDGVTRALEPGDVMICDASRAVAIGGVMGGEDTEVSASTTRLLLESASFDNARIARTSRRLGLRSEASVRFERGADPTAVAAAADRATELFVSLSGAHVGATTDVVARTRTIGPIAFRPARARALTGVEQDAEEMQRILQALGCDVSGSGQTLEVTPPSYRPDLTIEEDLVEEVIRVHGYDEVPEALPEGARTGGLTAVQALRRRARALMRAAGLNEAQTLSLLPPWVPDRLGLPAGHPWRTVRTLSNPLSEEESVLRPSLLPGLLVAAQRNVAHRVLPVLLFETGVCFTLDDAGATERLDLAWVMSGVAPTGWHGADRELDFFDAKGIFEALTRSLGIGDPDFRPAAESVVSTLLHPGRASQVFVGGVPVGLVAEVHPAAAEALELPRRVAVGTVELDVLLDAVGESRSPALPRFPAMERDIAVVVPEVVAAANVEATLRGAGGSLVEAIRLFDVYRGEQIGAGKVSLAYSVTLRDPERTLTDADADEAMGTIVTAVTGAGWSVRG